MKTNIWSHIAISNFLMYCFFLIFFTTYYLAGPVTASTATFICFTIFLIITFTSYRVNYRAVPSKRVLRKYKNDFAKLTEDRKKGGQRAFLLVITYLPLDLISLIISLIITYK